MPLDPSIPLRVERFSLSDLYREDDERKARGQQMDMQRQQFEAQQQQMQTQQAEQQKAQARQQASEIARLTTGVRDEADYQQRLAAGKAYGIDVSGAPPNYVPEWVQTQNIIANTFLAPDGERKLTTAAQQAEELTGKPISDPIAQQVMARILSDNVPVEGGGTVFSNNPLTGMAPAIVQNPGNQQVGAPATGGGDMPTVSSPQEAASLPPGTQFRTPDGRVMRVPGGPASAPGGFPGSGY